MTISLQLLLYIYYAFLAFYIIFAFFNLYHLVKFGFVTFGNVLISFLFIATTVVLVYFSLTLINTVDWNKTFTVFDFGGSNLYMP